MRRYLLVLALSLGSTCFCQTGYVISGTVVAGNTNKPIKHALVTIAEVGPAPRQISCVTGDDGRFVFTNLPAGKFALSAQRPNSLAEFFHEDEGYSTAIVTGPGLNSTDIVFPLTLAASISGVVNDDEGDPVRDAQVLLFHRAIVSGKLRTQSQATAQTDSRGNFHFGQLRPGTYFIAVQAQPWYAQNAFSASDANAQPASGAEFDVAYPITYYGGSTDPNSAFAITVSEGASNKIEITLHAVPTAHVQLSAPEVENGLALNFFVVGPDGYQIHANPTFIAVDKRQEFIGIAPGRYVVQEGSGGETTVDFSGHSVLELRNIAGCSISGHLILEGREHASADRGMVMFVSKDGTTLAARVEQDGTFKTSEAKAGSYEVQLANNSGYYIKSLEVGGRAVLDQQVDVTDGSAVQVSIVAAKGVSKMDGIAMKDGAPFAGATVLLLPSDLNRTSLIRRDQSDSDGTFSLANVAPGRYTLLAIDDGRDLAYTETAVINAYLGGGKIIDVPLAHDLRLNVAVQHRQP